MMLLESIALDLHDHGLVDPGKNWDIKVDTVTIYFANGNFRGITVSGRPPNRDQIQVTRVYDDISKVPDWAAAWTAYEMWRAR